MILKFKRFQVFIIDMTINSHEIFYNEDMHEARDGVKPTYQDFADPDLIRSDT